MVYKVWARISMIVQVESDKRLGGAQLSRAVSKKLKEAKLPEGVSYDHDSYVPDGCVTLNTGNGFKETAIKEMQIELK